MAYALARRSRPLRPGPSTRTLRPCDRGTRELSCEQRPWRSGGIRCTIPWRAREIDMTLRFASTTPHARMRGRNISTATIPLIIAISMFGLTSGTVGQESASKYVRQSPGDDTVIVFVHGFMGDGVTTWTNSRTNAYWPLLLTLDHTFDGNDVFVYSYQTGPNNAFSIDEIAENMRSVLTANGITNYNRIIFLSHSMGGLVTRAYLLKNRDVASHTSFAYFFSTPTTGSQIARLFQYIGSGPQLKSLVPLTPDAYLADLLRQWLAAGFGFPSYCAYEKEPTKGVALVVSMDSAVSLCTKPVDPIDTDHIDIVKPADQNSTTYTVFKAAYADATIPRLKTQLDEREKRKRVRIQLSQLLEEGLELQQLTGDTSRPPPDRETAIWIEKVKEHLHQELDDSYVVRFLDPSGLPTMTPWGQAPGPKNALLSAIIRMNTRLEEFIKEFSI